MGLRWNDSRQCPKCHTTVKQGDRRCPDHRGVDPYWTSTAVVSPKGAARKRVKVGSKACVRRTDLDDLKAVIEARFDGGGTYREPSTETVAEYLGRWHEGRRGELSPAYFKVAGYEIEGHLASSTLGSMRLGAVDRIAVKRFAAELEGKGLAGKTRSNIVGLLRRALTEAIEDGLRPGPNPATRIATGSTQPATEMLVWDVDEMRAFFAAIDGHDLYPMFRLMAVTGLRRGEAVGLRWTEVDLDEGRLQVTAAATVDLDGDQVLKAPKTKAGRRTVGLDAGTVTALRAHKRAQAASQLAVGSSWGNDTGLTFTDAVGDPVKLDYVSRTFKNLVEKIDGVRACRLHDLRHAAVSHMARNGLGLKAISVIVGHHSAAFTADQYGHMFPDQVDEAANVMGVVLDG